MGNEKKITLMFAFLGAHCRVWNAAFDKVIMHQIICRCKRVGIVAVLLPERRIAKFFFSYFFYLGSCK